MKKFDTKLYFITDSTGFEETEFLRRVEEALEGGATILQLREKNKSTIEYIELAEKVHELTKKYNVPLIIDVQQHMTLFVLLNIWFKKCILMIYYNHFTIMMKNS